jgi:hypothetical protein
MGRIGAFQDRRFRFQIANELWRECAGFIAPSEVVEIANEVDGELSGHGDGLALINATVARHGHSGARMHKISVLVSMVLIDRVNAELARVRTQR